MKNKYSLIAAGSFLIIPLLFSSCADLKNTVYFDGQRDSSVRSLTLAPVTYIQGNDLLSITVSSLNPLSTSIFNAANNSIISGTVTDGTSLQAQGYLVNSDGLIQFPVLGDLKVSGLTTNQIRQTITRQLTDRKLLVDPIVSVRQLNFKVSILGEVGHPTVINVPSEKISLLEALSLAGDITLYGKKDNVLVIREEKGGRKINRLNLNTNALFSSPYYYLKSNDIVYVQANKAKVASTSRGTYVLPIVLSGLSFVAIIATSFIRK